MGFIECVTQVLFVLYFTLIYSFCSFVGWASGLSTSGSDKDIWIWLSVHMDVWLGSEIVELSPSLCPLFLSKNFKACTCLQVSSFFCFVVPLHLRDLVMKILLDLPGHNCWTLHLWKLGECPLFWEASFGTLRLMEGVEDCPWGCTTKKGHMWFCMGVPPLSGKKYRRLYEDPC